MNKTHLKSLSELTTDMPCDKCKKKCGVPMDCKYCEGQFCMKCFRLEVHDCQGVDIKKIKQSKELAEKLAFEPPPKCLKI